MIPSLSFLSELRQEIEWLRSQLGIHDDDPTKVLDIIKSTGEVVKLREQLNEYEKLMKETNRSWEDKLKKTEERKKEEAEKLKVRIFLIILELVKMFDFDV